MTATAQEQKFFIEEVESSNPQWKAFVSARSGCFFCYPVWSQILDSGYGSQTKVYLMRRDGEIVLGIPAAHFDFGWFRLIHAYTPYGEFVGDQTQVPLFLKMLEAYLSARGIHQMRITRMHYETYEMDKSCRVREDCLQILDLNGRGEEALLASYKKNARRDVRIAQRAGMTAEVLQSQEEIDNYYAIYRKTMARKRVFGPHPRKLYHEIQNTLSREEAIFLAVRYKNQIIGGVILIFWKETVYLLGNVSDPEHHSLCPNDFLIHSSISLAAKRGFRYFDFMTTGESYKTPSRLSAFKEKWGALRYPFVVYEKDLNPGRAVLWNGLWRAVNAPLGSALLRLVMNR